MKFVITGNMGYVGPVVVSHIRRKFPESEIVGIDSGLFAHCITQHTLPERLLDAQYFRDVRDIDASMFEGADAVVHLAAVSNDPMGLRYEAVTEDVNQDASIRVAELAAQSGVRNFVFASSCSMYGFAESGERSENDELNPLTAYARSKVGAEKGLQEVSRKTGMTVTALRFATACGFSGRIRLDLVLNDFVASALATGKVTVLSDGSPWRPLIHVRDMARAIEWASQRKAGANANDTFLAVNAGCEAWNYQVCDLAEAVARAVPGAEVDINKNAQPDKRSYRVNFDLFKQLAPDHQPQVMLEEAVADIRDGLQAIGFKDPNYRSSPLIRYNVLGAGIEAGILSSDLRWTPASSGLSKDSAGPAENAA